MSALAEKYSHTNCEYLRNQTKQIFQPVQGTWIDVGSLVLPSRTKWMTSQTRGARNNHKLIDTTHVTALRSYTAGFLEGNTSATRPWYRHAHPDPDRNRYPENRWWLDLFTTRTLSLLTSSNFYNAAATFYNDFGTFNTGTYWITELQPYGLHFDVLEPGSYYILNDRFGIGNVLVREQSMNVKALVEEYGDKDANGKRTWENFSSRVKELYDRGSYATKIDLVVVCEPNEHFNVNEAVGFENRQWVTKSYEVGSARAGMDFTGEFNSEGFDPKSKKNQKYLRVDFSSRKPFIVGRSDSSGFEYGETGPATNAIGLIKSLNKKAISKDMAIEKMLAPTLQGSTTINKSYLTNQANRFIPLDATAITQGGLKTVFDINPAIGVLTGDVEDMRKQVDKHFFADFLLFLSMNPKTRTAEETRAIVNEQQLIIGPNLQSLNWTHNMPLVDFISSYVLENDPWLPPPPDDLQGEFLRTEMVSVFAQAQKAADLPSIDSYIQRMLNTAQFNPGAAQKIDFDKYADILEDRLFLPAGINRDQAATDGLRQQAQAQAQRQQTLEQIPGLAGAAKDLGAVQKGNAA